MKSTLAEVIPFEYKIVEAKGKSKRSGVLMALEGTFQRADTPNANKRVYPRGLWEKTIRDKDVIERLASRRMLGELDHPASGATSLSRVSHVITDHNLLEDGKIFGKMDILDTPSGNIAATLFEAGVQLGISSRGDGSVEKKGDLDEVQEDFRLETYDLVLKPSTPGAYPQIVESEEARKKNQELIASAVEGLVKSTDDLNVLLECHKIINVLDGCESRCESVSSSIKSKLEGRRGTTEQKPQLEERNMQTQVPGSTDAPVLNLSPEMARVIQGMVEAKVAEAAAKKEAEVAKLNERIVQLVDENKTQAKKIEAAEALIEEFTRKVKDLSEGKRADSDLQIRYDASVRLLDESINRLQELGHTKRRLRAAESLLAASINRHRNEALNIEINRTMKGLDEETAKKIRPLLAECKTVADVKKHFGALKGLIETRSARVREPLPKRRGKGLTEQRPEKVEPAKTNQDFITSRLIARVG